MDRTGRRCVVGGGLTGVCDWRWMVGRAGGSLPSSNSIASRGFFLFFCFFVRKWVDARW